MLRRVNLSAAAAVLVCFFLPWVQVSCGGAHDTLNGLDLARHEDALLWFVPILMLVVLIVGLVRRSSESRPAAAIASAICGAISAVAMNRERMRVNDDTGLIAAQLTGWFWLSLIAALVITASGIALFLRRRTN